MHPATSLSLIQNSSVTKILRRPLCTEGFKVQVFVIVLTLFTKKSPKVEAILISGISAPDKKSLSGSLVTFLSFAMLTASQSDLELPGNIPLLTFFDFVQWKYDLSSLLRVFRRLFFLGCYLELFF